MKLLGVEKNQTIYVGNSEEDILTARAAEVIDVIVERKEYKPTIEPSVKIPDLYGLRKLIKI
jgi:phosphoglycolate phosphatase-like HAD superfamily hydrolase